MRFGAIKCANTYFRPKNIRVYCLKSDFVAKNGQSEDKSALNKSPKENSTTQHLQENNKGQSGISEDHDTNKINTK